jgi:hypothetical protein
MLTTVELLLKTLNSNRDILESLFEKRNRTVYIHEVLSDISNEKLLFLEELELLNINDNIVELDNKVVDFFEEFLDTSSDVSIGDIDEQLENLSHFIGLYQNENEFILKQNNLNKIRRILKKIPAMILKNLIQLSLHVGLTYKTQTNFKNKIKELEFYQGKLKRLISIEQKVNKTLLVHKSFFVNLYDMELVQLEINLKTKLRELRISLIELQKEVTQYINRILEKISFWQHLIKLKNLKDNYELKEKTNITLLCEEKLPLSFSNSTLSAKTHLNSELLYKKEFILKVKKQIQNKKLAKPKQILSGKIDDIYFDKAKLQKNIIDTQKLNKEFLQTKYNLFEFIEFKKFNTDISFEQKIELYCKMLLEFESDYDFSSKHQVSNNTKYLLVYPKESV